MREVYHKWIMVIFGGIIAFAIGYFIGFSNGIKFIVTIAVDFLRNQGVDFSLPAHEIAELINRYTGYIRSG